jgi:PTS system nitrogen regulatory IIA component
MPNLEETSIHELLRRGGVWYDIPGTTPKDALTHIIGTIPAPPSVDRKLLLEAVLEREALMSTAVGYGIALPHPRNPIVGRADEQFAAAAFLSRPVDWNALDGKPVHTVLLIVSSSAKLHLHTLSRINFFCQQEAFRGLLESRASLEEITRMIAEAEAAWK